MIKKTKEISTELEKAIIEGKDILASKEEVIRELGQIQAFDFIQKLATVASLKLIQKAKDTKLYKGLTYINDEEKAATVATWDEFCQFKLNSPRRTIEDRLVNLAAFGEEFYEASQNIGLGVRDLRKLRQLPDGDQSVIIDSEAVELGDKEAVKELIEDLTIQHKKEKSELKKELKDTDAQLKANREMSAENAVKLQDAQEALAVKKFNKDEWQGEVKDFFASLHEMQNNMIENLDHMLALNEQLEFVEMDERAKDSASSAFYADCQLLVDRFALTWNEIHRTLGHLEETAKPSGQWLTELGFEGMGEEA